MRAQLRTAAVIALALAFPAASMSADPEPSERTATTSPARPLPARMAAPVVVLDHQEAQGILGKDVRSTAGEDMGRIVDVIVDRAGQPRAAVIDFGGFLGVGSRKVVVEWSALHFNPAEHRDRITLDLTRDQVK